MARCKALDVAKYLLQIDRSNGLLNDKRLTHKNTRDFYSGNGRLNKYLHLAQNIFYAKTGELLFKENMYAFDNGAVVEEVRTKYAFLISKIDSYNINLDKEVCEFLNKLYVILKDATLDDLIELSHQDNEWVDKHKDKDYRDKETQIMNTEKRLDEYKEQYKDVIDLINRMPA